MPERSQVGPLTRTFGKAIIEYFRDHDPCRQAFCDLREGDDSCEGGGFKRTRALIGADPNHDTKWIDVMVATNRAGTANDVLCVIEIEESESSPVDLIGDVFAILMANTIYSDKLHFTITDTTRLVVAGWAEDKPGGRKFSKYENVIIPRFRDSTGFPGGIRPQNVELIVAPSKSQLMPMLEERIVQLLGLTPDPFTVVSEL